MRGTTIAQAVRIISFVCAAAVCTSARAQGTSPGTWENRRSIVVHIDSPERVDLERETGNKRDPFYSACTSPCDEAVPADGRYRISGDSARPSRRFTLPQTVDRETIVVEPASRTWFTVGILSLSLGVAAEGVGGLVLLATALSDGPAGSSNGGTVGFALVGGGLAAIAGGVALFVVNMHSHVTQNGDRIGQVIGPRWLRAQAWREGEPDAKRDPMSINAVPLMRGVF